MTKKIIFTLFGIFTIFSAYAAQIVNVEYIHQLINQKWDITLNYSPELRSEKAAANMKYLLTAIDVANEILNGEPTTDYGNGEFATTQAVDTIATNTAVDTLVKKPEKYKFSVFINTARYKRFQFDISAAGTFYIDWGDGTEEVVEKADTTKKTYYHTYATVDQYTMRLGGVATGYSVSDTTAAIYFDWDDVEPMITGIDGCLGCVFPTLADGSQPRFYRTFEIIPITSIPENLFDGIHGATVPGMFYFMFRGTRITSIPENLFAGLDPTVPLADNAFIWTFSNCSGLTGPSARINGQYLYEIWPDATSTQVGSMYYNATGLSDYANIPDAWKSW